MFKRSLYNLWQKSYHGIVEQSLHIVSLALIALIGLAWVASNSHFANAQSTGGFMTFNTPDAGDVWYYGESEQININLQQAPTQALVLRTYLCVADAAGTCATAQAIADYTVAPNGDTNHTIVWSQVGYDINSEKIIGNYTNNAQLLIQTFLASDTTTPIGGGYSPVFSIEDRIVEFMEINITDPVANDTWILGGQEPLAFSMTNFPISPSNPSTTHAIRAVLVTGFSAGGYLGSGLDIYRYDLGEWQLGNGQHNLSITVPSDVQISDGFPVTLYVYAPDFENAVDSVMSIQLVEPQIDAPSAQVIVGSNIGTQRESVELGDTVSSAIGLNVQDLPVNHEVKSGRVVLTYDPAKLEYASVAPIEAQPVIDINSQPGRLMIDFTVANPVLHNLFTVNWTAVGLGDTNVTVASITPFTAGDDADLFIGTITPDTTNTTADIVESQLRAHAITVTPVGGAAGANYYSAKFSVANNQSQFSDITSLTANFNPVRGSGDVLTATTFSIGFFNAAGANLCTVHTCTNTAQISFDSEGFLQVAGIEPNVAADLTLGSATWKQEVAFMQVKIHMASSNPAGDPTAQPWVQSVELSYDSQDTAPFILSITPVTAQLAANGSAQFEVTAVRLNSFSDSIALTDDIAAIFGANIASVTYSANSIPANSNGPVTITVTASSAPTAQTAFFTVTGSAAGTSTEVDSQIVLSGGGSGGTTKDITLELTVPIEGGHDGIQPVMTFRLYNAANQQAFSKSDVLTNRTTNKVTLNIEDLTVGAVYRGYIRSTRHLFRAAEASITIQASQDAYAMSFSRLMSGDLDPNNVVNAIDFPLLTREWGRSGTGIIPDINADSAVNALDVVGVVSNWFRSGAQLPAN